MNIKLKKDLNKLLAGLTKQSLRKVEKDTDRNFFMSAEKAKAYGIIDEILVTRD